ncbi:MAG: hypothetical protein Kow0063_18720 [Anaerolineae bacterium]
MIRVLSSPALISLELTPLCNSHCSGCFNVFLDEGRGRRDVPVRRPPLPFDGWRKILDQLAPHVHRLKLTGGEPTLHPDFEAILGYIRQLDISVTVFTNGRWPHPERVLEALRRTPNLDGLLVSLHGARAASHEAYSGVPGSFDETVSNIRRAIELGIPVTLSTVLHLANLDELAEIVSLARSLGAGRVAFNRYLGRPLPGLALSDDQLKQATRTIDAMRGAGQSVAFGVGIPQCFTPSSSTGCLAGVAYCAVDPWGNLRPCNHSDLVAGNLLRRTLEEAWTSPVMERFREAIPDACHTCAAFPTCHAGCRALAMELNLAGDPLMVGPLSEFGPPPPVRMGRNWRPLRRFDLRQEAFGLVLMRGNALLAVRPEAIPILDHLNGAHTLEDLEQAFGPVGLSLIGELFQRNMVEMKA